MVVRLLLAGSVKRSFDPLHSARGLRDIAAQSIGLKEAENLAITNVELASPELGFGEARIEIGSANQAMARCVALALDREETLSLPGGRFELATIDAVELDIETRLHRRSGESQWRLRFLSPTATGDDPLPTIDSLFEDLLARTIEVCPAVGVPFVGRRLGDLVSLTDYDLQSCPVQDRLGWIGWVQLRKAPEVSSTVPIELLLHTAEVIGLGHHRCLGHGSVRVSDVRHRNAA